MILNTIKCEVQVNLSNLKNFQQKPELTYTAGLKPKPLPQRGQQMEEYS